jgi:hypothetical protein
MTSASRVRTRCALPAAAIGACALAMLAAGCGGGADPLAGSTSASSSPAVRSSAPSAPAARIAPGQVFSAAELLYPALFPTPANCEARALQPNGTPLRGAARASFLKKCSDNSLLPADWSDLAHEGRIFRVRAYSNGNYLGVASDDHVYGLGPYTAGALSDFGSLAQLSDLVCQTVSC